MAVSAVMLVFVIVFILAMTMLPAIPIVLFLIISC